MKRKKRKQVSFDTVVKFFMQQYNIPTRKDVDKIIERLDRLEKLIKTSAKGKRPSRVESARARKTSRKSAMTASDVVLEYLKSAKNGAGFADIRAETEFEDKKLRNIIFRLNKLKKIKRLSRGTYVAA